MSIYRELSKDALISIVEMQFREIKRLTEEKNQAEKHSKDLFSELSFERDQHWVLKKQYAELMEEEEERLKRSPEDYFSTEQQKAETPTVTLDDFDPVIKNGISGYEIVDGDKYVNIGEYATFIGCADKETEYWRCDYSLGGTSIIPAVHHSTPNEALSYLMETRPEAKKWLEEQVAKRRKEQKKEPERCDVTLHDFDEVGTRGEEFGCRDRVFELSDGYRSMQLYEVSDDWKWNYHNGDQFEEQFDFSYLPKEAIEDFLINKPECTAWLQAQAEKRRSEKQKEPERCDVALHDFDEVRWIGGASFVISDGKGFLHIYKYSGFWDWMHYDELSTKRNNEKDSPEEALEDFLENQPEGAAWLQEVVAKRRSEKQKERGED